MNEEMLAAVFHGIEQGVRVEKRPIPLVRNPNDVLIEVQGCSICGSDAAILQGRHPSSPPVVLGHEYGGIVRKVGDGVKSVKVGDHVVVDPNLKCGECYYCRNGMQNFCENWRTLGIHLDGGFAKYNIAPEKAVWRIPSNMPWEDAFLIEPVSNVAYGATRAGVSPGKSVLVIGAGPIGLIWIALMKKASASMLIASEIMPARMEAAKRIGADVVINPKKEDLVEKVKELTEGRGVDIAVEAVGHPSTAQQAIEAISPRGRAVMFGQTPPAATIPIVPHDIMRYEKEIVGSYTNGYMFASAIRIMLAKQVPSDVILTHRFKVSEFDRAMATHLSGESIKVLVSPQT